MQFTTLEGVTLHFAREGQGQATPLVFINSLGSDYRIWDDAVELLASDYPLLRYDKRGHGLSDCPPGPYIIRDHSADLLALLDHSRIHQAVLIGVSVGGMIALDITARHPERVKGLVLCDTGAKIGTPEFWEARIAAIREHGLSEVATTVLQRWFAPSFAEAHPAAYQGYYNMLSRTPEEGYIATCQAIRDADLRPTLKDIHAKTLIMCGAEDASTPPELGRELAQALPNARFDLIQNAGHLPSIEQPTVLAAKIKAFLEEEIYGG